MIYGTDSTQLQRHLRFRETILFSVPCYAQPMEGVITKIVGDEGQEYVRIEAKSLYTNFWAKASDLQVIAILHTPEPPKPVNPNQFIVAPDWNAKLQEEYSKFLNNEFKKLGEGPDQLPPEDKK
jgi:hypothetical protein